MSNKAILLVHGFHRSPLHLKSMATFFQSQGFVVFTPELPTTTGRLVTCATLLADFWNSEPRNFAEVHLVGHSYGGLILREFLAQQSIPNLCSLTCFGSSHHGSRIADWLVCFGRHRKEAALLDFRTPGPYIRPPRQGWPAKVHLLAGNRNSLYLGRLFLKAPADGRLTTESALALSAVGTPCAFPPWTQRTTLPLDHHEMMDSHEMFDAILFGIEKS